MIDSLCQAYHWPFDAAMRLTMPQVIMLNHASHVNMRRMEQRQDKKRKNDETDPIVFKGKRLRELNSDEMSEYYAGFGE